MSDPNSNKIKEQWLQEDISETERSEAVDARQSLTVHNLKEGHRPSMHQPNHR